jgi:hypothetical protein
MDDVITRFQRWLDRTEIELDVEAELQFHIEQLRQEHLKRGLSEVDAGAASLRRFGDFEQIKHECIEISERSHNQVRVLRILFTILLFAGVLVRVFRTELQLTHLGDVLMMVAFAGHIFLYVRGLSPANFIPPADATQSLHLIERSQIPVALDEQKRTPTERLISD